MAVLPGIVAITMAWLALTLLGLLVGACWGLRPRAAVLAAAPIACGLLAGEAVVLPGRPRPVIAGFIAVAALGLAARWAGPARRATVRDDLRAWRTELPGLEVAALALTMAISTVTILWACGGSLDMASQSNDAMFHVNGIKNVSLGGSLNPWSFEYFVGGIAKGTAYYPTAFAALGVFVVHAAGVDAVPAANIAAVLLAGALWPSSMLLLVRQVFGRTTVTMVAAAALSQSFWGFPWDPLGWGVLWPTAEALAIVPLVFVGLLALLRAPGDHSMLSRRSGALVLALATVALMLAHPRMVVVIVPELVVVAAACLARHSAWRPHPPVLRAACGVGALLAVCVPFVLWYGAGKSAKVTAIPWHVTETTGQAINGYLLNGPNHTTPGLIVAALVLLGVLIAVTRRATVWIVPTYLVAIVLDVLTSTGRSPGITQITRLWYGDRNRTSGVVPVAGVLLGVMGATLIWTMVSERLARTARPRRTAHPRRAAIACAVLAAALAVNVPGHIDYLKRSFVDGSNDPVASFVSPAQIALYQSLASIVPPGQTILNDPTDGTPFLFAYSGRRPAYFTFEDLTGARHARALRIHMIFDRNHARICSMLSQDHLSWVIVVGPSSDHPTVGRRSAAGMQIPPRFWATTKVASAGTTTLYKVTGCPIKRT